MRSKHNNQISNTRNTRVTRSHTRDAQSARLFMTPCCGGFTLIEIMLALGVLGIGMVLVATLFPPAIMQARRADRNTMAMILSQNSKAALEIRSSMVPDHDIFANADGEFVIVPIGQENLGGTGSNDDLIHPRDALYTLRRGAGWQALVRKMNDTNDDGNIDSDDDPVYQFVVVPFILPATLVTSPPDSSLSASAYETRLNDYVDELDGIVFDTSASHVTNRLVHVAQGADVDSDVIIRQTPIDGCIMRLKKSDFGNDLANLNWLAIGSPVILDGDDRDDHAFLGKAVTILDVRDDDDEPNTYWAVELSDTLVDARHDDWDNDDEDGDGDNDNDIELEDRGVWVFSSGAYGAQSPAIGSYVFTAVVR